MQRVLGMTVCKITEYKMKNKKIKISLVFFSIIGIMFLSGCGTNQGEKRYPTKLEIWGLFDDSDTFSEIFEVYRKMNQNIQGITYKKLTPDTYQKELVEALASGQGPDIFLIQNTWTPSFANKIAPATPDILSEQKFRSEFVDVAADDFINQSKIYAVPLSVDTLGLYYNKDLFNQAGITSPPKNWNDFIANTIKMTKINSFGQITQSGAAMGTACISGGENNNINRCTDILNLLMLQGKTEMLDNALAQAAFDRFSQNNNENISPGENALNFYTSFAKRNSSLQNYSWNKDMHYSIDAFSEGNLAMMLNYSWQIPIIQSKAPKLNFAVAPAPQIDEAHPINYPNYWGFAVAKNKKAAMATASNGQQVAIPDEARIAETWKFLKFLTAKPEINPEQPAALVYDAAMKYAEKTRRPAARRDIIETQKNDVEIGVFAKQNLTAKNWMQVDPAAVEAIFADMIDKVNRGVASVSEALKAGARQVTQTMNQ